MSAPETEPPRIRKFRKALIKSIPRVPNDRASLVHMEQKRLSELLIDYVSWAARYVGARPRRVIIDPATQADPRWRLPEVIAFLSKVEQGEDLTPHLSIKPHTQGYALAARQPGATSDERWSDKDFLLHAMNYHHFHLDAAGPTGGHGQGPGELIFAEVTREEFTAVAIFGHGVFLPSSNERDRLWALHQQVVSRSMAPGTAYIAGAIATSGHTLQSVRYADHCSYLVREIEPKLDDPDFMRSLYAHPKDAPRQSKPEWFFHHLDLAIFDKAKPGLLIVQKGWV